MKKFLVFVATAVAVTMLSAPVAYAAPSPTEPDLLLEEFGEQEVPLAGVEEDPLMGVEEDPLVGVEEDPLEEIGDWDVPLGDAWWDEPMEEIDDPDVPLAYIPAPQTGVTGLLGMEALALAAMAFTVSGAAVLVKARKQARSVR